MLLYISIAANIVLALIIILMLSYAKVRSTIRYLVAQAEALIPGKTGADKLAWVLEQAAKNSFLAKFLSNQTLTKLVEQALKIMKDYAENRK